MQRGPPAPATRRHAPVGEAVHLLVAASSSCSSGSSSATTSADLPRCFGRVGRPSSAETAPRAATAGRPTIRVSPPGSRTAHRPRLGLAHASAAFANIGLGLRRAIQRTIFRLTLAVGFSRLAGAGSAAARTSATPRARAGDLPASPGSGRRPRLQACRRPRPWFLRASNLFRARLPPLPAWLIAAPDADRNAPLPRPWLRPRRATLSALAGGGLFCSVAAPCGAQLRRQLLPPRHWRCRLRRSGACCYVPARSKPSISASSFSDCVFLVHCFSNPTFGGSVRLHCIRRCHE